MQDTIAANQMQTPESILKQAYRTLGMIPIILVALIIILGIINPRFLTLSNAINVARQACFLGLVSMGQMMVILTKGVEPNGEPNTGKMIVVYGNDSKKMTMSATHQDTDIKVMEISYTRKK